MKLAPEGARIVRFVVTAVLLLLVFRSVDLDQLRPNLARLHLTTLVLLLLLHWTSQMISAQRWRILAAALGIGGSYPKFCRTYFASMFFNIGLPALGADAIRACSISQTSDSPVADAAASVLQDRAAGLIGLLLYGSLGVLLAPLQWRAIPISVIYLAGWAGVAAAILLVRKSKPAYLPQKRLGLVFLLSAVNSGLVIWIVQRLSAALGAQLDMLTACALVPVIDMVTMLPISVAGIGIREWAFIEGFGLLGISRDLSLAIALALSALVILRNLAGVFFLGTIPASLRGGRTGE